MSVRALNNFGTAIVTGINDVAQSIALAAGSCDTIRAKLGLSAGSDLATGDYFYATIFDIAGAFEIVKVTSIGTSGDAVTVVRGQDNTTARAWLSGSAFHCRPNAAVFADMLAAATNIDGLHFLGNAGIALAADTTLNLTTHEEHWLYVTASATITLPAVGTTTIGRTTYTLLALADFTLKGDGADSITLPGVAAANSHFIHKGQTVTVVSNGSAWYAVLATWSLNPAAYAAGGTLQGDADTMLVWDASASKIVKLTVSDVLAAAGISSKQTIAIPASALAPRKTNGCAPLTYTTGSAGQPDIPYLAFDSASAEYAGIVIPMPKGWDRGPVTASFQWRRASGSAAASVVWGVRAVAVSDADSGAATFGSGASVTDDAKDAPDKFALSDETGACTIGGSPAESDLVFFEFYRDGVSVSDTLDGVDAYLTSVRLHYTVSRLSDA